ncbi:MAG TPA: class E sortase [Pseudonocardiaceae bacterium]
MTVRGEVASEGFRGSPLRLVVDGTEGRGAGGGPEGGGGVDVQLAPRVGGGRPPPDAGPGGGLDYRLFGHVLAIVAVLSLSFIIELTFLGDVLHSRDQAQLWAQFRIELANGVAPVGPLDESNTALALGTPVALLEIPKLSIREVVVEGTSSEVTMSGPGHRRDTPLPGQVGTSVIAGRRATYGGPFKTIDRLRAGDQIVVVTGQGRHVFKVFGVRRAGSPLPPALPKGLGRLSLLTTDGPATQPKDVMRVDAALVGAAQPRGAALPAGALGASEAVMAGDATALLGVIGWSVLLLVAAIGAVWIQYRVGSWQAWVIGLPVLLTIGLLVIDQVAALLPNVL